MKSRAFGNTNRMDEQKNEFSERIERIQRRLKLNESADLKSARIEIAGKACVYFYADGFLDKSALERVLGNAKSIDASVWENVGSISRFSERYLSFSDCAVSNEDRAIEQVLRGFTLFLFEAFPDQPLVAEVRHVPQRSLKEPDKGKTLRGPHEGFGESLNVNLALLRRRIVNEKLRCESFVAGKKTQTRLALCYLEGTADPKLLHEIRNRLKRLRDKAVCSGEENVTEALFFRSGIGLLNPLPRVRYTERPDTCAAELLEGRLVILTDTTPNAIILPITLFDFMEESDDYYFPPLTASYLRFVRLFSFLASVFLVPLWLLAVKLDAQIPNDFSFLLISDEYAVPVFLQLLLIEFSVDALKLASLNTPEPLANSLSVVGGLLLGDFAVKSGWFVPQTILYSALVAITSFIPNNYELGYSLKFARILLICAVEAFSVWGLIGASAFLIAALILTRKEIGMRGFLYPFYPFSVRGIMKLVFRTRTGREEKNER